MRSRHKGVAVSVIWSRTVLRFTNILLKFPWNSGKKQARDPGPWWQCSLDKVLQPLQESLGGMKCLFPRRRVSKLLWCFRMHCPLGPREKPLAEAGVGTKQSAGASVHSSLKF